MSMNVGSWVGVFGDDCVVRCYRCCIESRAGQEVELLRRRYASEHNHIPGYGENFTDDLAVQN